MHRVTKYLRKHPITIAIMITLVVSLGTLPNANTMAASDGKHAGSELRPAHPDNSPVPSLAGQFRTKLRANASRSFAGIIVTNNNTAIQVLSTGDNTVAHSVV